MRVRKLLVATLVGMLFVLSVFPTFAQGIISRPGDEHPIFELMAMIPDSAIMREGIVYYTDWRAAELVVQGLSAPESYAEWDEFVWPYLRIISQPQFQYLIQYDRTPGVMGMDFFDIDRTMSAGNPPSTYTIYAGELNPTAISLTLASRSERGAGRYEPATINGINAWCWVEGCDAGLEVDVMGRDPANLLDPSALGRNPPLFLTDKSLAFAFDLGVMEAAADAINDTCPSLADADDYSALAEAIIDPEAIAGILVQAQFVPPKELRYTLDLNDPAPLISEIGAIEELATALAESDEFATYGGLPQYDMAVLADHQGGGELIATIGLLYDDEADAQAAAEELANRLESYSNIIRFGSGQPPIIADLGGVVQSPITFTAANGQTVVLVSVTYPVPDYESGGDDERPGALFRVLVDGVLSRSLYPLWEVIQAE